MENSTGTNTPNQPNLPKPNIIFITVDQLRFPMHLPPNPSNPSIPMTPEQFLEKYMPNLFGYLWSPGVKFSNYYTAASDCTAARATIHTGLYAYQTYSMLTLITFPPAFPTQPVLETDFPTIGKLMRDEAKYEVRPYFGKWHLSYDVADLEDYGYTSYTPNQDYVGYAGQGLATDDTPAWEAAHWINTHLAQTDPKPFFLTLNFVNPHDKQWFWGAMQAHKFQEVYQAIPETPPGPYIEIPGQAEPERIYPENIYAAIPNFEDQAELSLKPATQTLVKEVFQYQMGGIYEVDEFKAGKYTPVPSPEGFYYAEAPAHPGHHKAIAPETYWSKALDSYVQITTQVDNSIGNFMRSLSEDVRQNTIFVFTSDHGEYASSHGLQGKGGTVYEEGIRVPLIVRDSRSNGYAKNPEQMRNQLTSSVDLLPMIVSMGCNGTGWMTGDYQQLYGNRCDLLKILREYNADGRTNALHSTDEFVPYPNNYNNSNMHVIGLIQTNLNGGNKQKLGVYTTWANYSVGQSQATVNNPMSQSPPDTQNMEFYDPTNEVDEIKSTPTSTQAQAANALLFSQLLPNELQAQLPDKYKAAQKNAYELLIKYMTEVQEMADRQSGSSTAAAPEEVKRRAARVWAF